MWKTLGIPVCLVPILTLKNYVMLATWERTVAVSFSQLKNKCNPTALLPSRLYLQDLCTVVGKPNTNKHEQADAREASRDRLPQVHTPGLSTCCSAAWIRSFWNLPADVERRKVAWGVLCCVERPLWCVAIVSYPGCAFGFPMPVHWRYLHCDHSITWSLFCEPWKSMNENWRTALYMRFSQ